LKNRKAQEFRPWVEKALALPGAARYPGAVLRVVEAWHRDERPDQYDLAALEGRELRSYSHEDLPPPSNLTLAELPPNVQELVAANRKGRPAAS